jgi:hypothetical protein
LLVACTVDGSMMGSGTAGQRIRRWPCGRGRVAARAEDGAGQRACGRRRGTPAGRRSVDAHGFDTGAVQRPPGHSCRCRWDDLRSQHGQFAAPSVASLLALWHRRAAKSRLRQRRRGWRVCARKRPLGVSHRPQFLVGRIRLAHVTATSADVRAATSAISLSRRAAECAGSSTSAVLLFVPACPRPLPDRRDENLSSLGLGSPPAASAQAVRSEASRSSSPAIPTSVNSA